MPRGRPRKDAAVDSPSPASLAQTKTPAAALKRSASGKNPLAKQHSGRKMREIKNSSDVDTDLNDEDSLAAVKHQANDRLQTKQKLPGDPTKEILKEVAIPANKLSLPARQGQTMPSRSPSSMGSGLSSVGDLSTEYETPGTSAAVTPAESLVKRPALNQGPLGLEVSRGKRKRNLPAADEMLEADALHAQALQDEEYAEEDVKPQKARRAPAIIPDDSDDEMEDNFRGPVDDSENEFGSLSDLDIVPQNKAGPSTSKRRKLSGRPALPSRSARDKAWRSITQKATLQVQDSDESALSELSEFVSEVDSEDLEEESQASEDDVPPMGESIQAGLAQRQSILRSQQQMAARGARRSGGGVRSARSRAWRARMAGGLLDRAARERAKLERAHPEIKTMWDTIKAVPMIAPKEAEQPTTITRKLKSFQLEGLGWMMEQENSQWKGGLLGDEMGMGKTIQAVSLIMSDYPAQSPSLVVVPPVALMQWQNEINEYTNGKLKVLVYHNTNPKVRNMKMKELKGYDVIMISYSGLESIYRKESKGWKRDDGIVKENSKIHAIHYHRLILDEAHNIKSRNTGCAKACFALRADHKWCLSGTPVQNRIGEFFSLLRFLEIRPFACYFCKTCSCAELHWSQDASKKCTHCGHSGFSHVSIFNQELLNPITQGQDDELRREGLAKLRLVTDRIMLRRIKRDHTASMELPPKDVIIHNEFFGDIERDFSSSIMSNTARQFDTYVSRGVMLNNYANIFGLIMQMRQVANHPDLILKKHAEGGQNVLICCICDETAEEPIRSRCHHEFCRSCAKDYVRSFEQDASPDCPRCHISLNIDLDQPDIEQDEDHVKKSSIINRIKMEDWTSSTKIEMLVYDLYKLRSRKQTHKSIVFSQFTSMLQLVEWRLRRAGFNTVMLDGSMSPAQRQRSIEYFMNNTHVEVFLVSLKAGGVALNLTEASRVFIVDPWWNPAAEWQSADRCHRIGQRRPCVITRLCIEDSVESRMVMLQEKKANMINGTINNDQVAMEKLTPEDMQFLFRGS
ncbi:MAG: hypothetical protein LQ344_003055 [Seirophora lacunosa]|nr:MAG: hypothetical protein LQ344_003055 [Seirophora lacunosa]